VASQCASVGAPTPTTKDAETSTSAPSAVLDYAALLERFDTSDGIILYIFGNIISSLHSGRNSSQPLPLSLSEMLTVNEQALFLAAEQARSVYPPRLISDIVCDQLFLPQALSESTSIILDTSFGSMSGIAEKFGVDGSEGLPRTSAKEIASAIMQEICEQEEEGQGLSHQRNREAREVRGSSVADFSEVNVLLCLQVLAGARLSLQHFAQVFSYGYRKICEAQTRSGIHLPQC
jgi:hypothetical protein